MITNLSYQDLCFILFPLDDDKHNFHSQMAIHLPSLMSILFFLLLFLLHLLLHGFLHLSLVFVFKLSSATIGHKLPPVSIHPFTSNRFPIHWHGHCIVSLPLALVGFHFYNLFVLSMPTNQRTNEYTHTTREEEGFWVTTRSLRWVFMRTLIRWCCCCWCSLLPFFPRMLCTKCVSEIEPVSVEHHTHTHNKQIDDNDM